MVPVVDFLDSLSNWEDFVPVCPIPGSTGGAKVRNSVQYRRTPQSTSIHVCSVGSTHREDVSHGEDVGISAFPDGNQLFKPEFVYRTHISLHPEGAGVFAAQEGTNVLVGAKKHAVGGIGIFSGGRIALVGEGVKLGAEFKQNFLVHGAILARSQHEFNILTRVWFECGDKFCQFWKPLFITAPEG